MPLFRIAAPVQGPNPTRVAAFQGTMRAGEDLKVAFLLLDEDGETPLHVESANASLSLWPADYPGGFRHDYGWHRPAFYDRAEYAAAGQVLDGAVGRINFQLPSALTSRLCDRYRMRIDVDLPEGVSTTMEGMLQVRPGPAAPGNAARTYMQIGATPLGMGMLPAGSVAGLPADADSFPVLAAAQLPLPVSVQETPGDTSILGFGILGHIVLGH